MLRIQYWATNQVTRHLPLHHQHRHIINDTSLDRSHRAEHVLIVHFVQLSTLLMHYSPITMHAWWWCWIDDCASSEWRMEVKATHILIDLIELHTNIMSFSFHSQFSCCHVDIQPSMGMSCVATVHYRFKRIENGSEKDMIFVCNSMRSISICVAFTPILHSLEAQSPIQHHHYACMVMCE